MIPVNVINGESYYVNAPYYSPYFPYIILMLCVTIAYFIYRKKKNETNIGANFY